MMGVEGVNLMTVFLENQLMKLPKKEQVVQDPPKEDLVKNEKVLDIEQNFWTKDYLTIILVDQSKTAFSSSSVSIIWKGWGIRDN